MLRSSPKLQVTDEGRAQDGVHSDERLNTMNNTLRKFVDYILCRRRTVVSDGEVVSVDVVEERFPNPFAAAEQ